MWKPIDTAPKDGTWLKVRGRDFGDTQLKRHYAIAFYEDGNWNEVGSDGGHLYYLTDWQPFSIQLSDPTPEQAEYIKRISPQNPDA